MIATLKNNSISRILKLVILQIGDKIRDFKKGDKKKIAFKIFLLVILSLSITAIISAALIILKKNFSFTYYGDLLVSIIFLTQIIDIISNIDNITEVLYSSKENVILLSYPCKYNEIFISKIIIFALDELKRGCFFLLPFLISYGIAVIRPVQYYLLIIPMWIILSLFPVLISASLSIVVSWTKRFLNNNLWLYTILSIVFFVFLFILLIYAKEAFSNVLRSINKNGEPSLKLIALYGLIMNFIRTKVIVTINKFAIFYNFVDDIMLLNNSLLFFVLLIIILLVIGAICFLVAMPFYFKAVSSTNENSARKIHKKFTNIRNDNIFFTFLRKEFTLLFRTPTKLKDAISVIFLLPLIVFIMNFVVATINTNSLGTYLTIAFNFIIIMSLLSTHNANCAMEISSEGSEFQILKASPSNTMTITWAKCFVNVIINFAALSVSIIMLLYTTNLSSIDLLYVFITILLFTTGQIFWSFEFDVRNPKISEYVEKGDAVINNSNVGKAMAMGFITSTIFGLLSLILLLDNYQAGWIKIIIIAFLFFIARLYLYNRNLKMFFNDIQM